MLAGILLQEAGPNTELSWLLYLFLAFFFLMVSVGWLTSRRGGNRSEITPAPDELSNHEGSQHSA